MKLYLMRHGEAENTWPDSERCLTDKGRERSAKVARILRSAGVEPGVKVVSSTLVRARQTADIVRRELNSTCGELIWEGVTPSDPTEPLALQLCTVPDDLVLVGHNPLFSMLAARLLTDDELGMGIAFKKSGCLCLERIDPFRKTATARPGWVLRAYWVP